MAADGAASAAKEARRRAGRARALAVTLLSVGMMLAGVGAVLSGLCLVAGGIICEGTSEADIGHFMVGLGVPLLAAAVVFTRRASRASVRWNSGGGPDTAAAQARLAAVGEVPGPSAGPFASGRPPAASGPVPSNCPECGAPLPPGASVCSYCGETFA